MTDEELYKKAKAYALSKCENKIDYLDYGSLVETAYIDGSKENLLSYLMRG